MDYEKAYKDLMRDIDIAIEGQNDGETKVVLQNIKERNIESEDERIRTRLIALVEAFGQGEYKDEMLAYLERQKEQKPADQGVKGRRGRIGGTPEHIRKKAENFLSKMKPPYDADDICSAYETGAMESIKLEWSEEDEKHLNWVIEHFRQSGELYHDLIDWLKSLPERFNLQPKQEWSEEDEKIRETLLNYYEECLDNYSCVEWLNGITYSELCDWLKSFRPQPHWKPSEKQMKVLKAAIVYVESSESNFKWSGSVLESLYNDLKSL